MKDRNLKNCLHPFTSWHRCSRMPLLTRSCSRPTSPMPGERRCQTRPGPMRCPQTFAHCWRAARPSGWTAFVCMRGIAWVFQVCSPQGVVSVRLHLALFLIFLCPAAFVLFGQNLRV